MRIQIDLPEVKILRLISTGRFDHFVTLFGFLGNDTKVNLALYHEPDNAVDKYAIKVCCGTIPIGYLLREDAFAYNHMLHVIKSLEAQDKLKVNAHFVDFHVHKTDDGRLFRNIAVELAKKH